MRNANDIFRDFFGGKDPFADFFNDDDEFFGGGFPMMGGAFGGGMQGMHSMNMGGQMRQPK